MYNIFFFYNFLTFVFKIEIVLACKFVKKVDQSNPIIWGLLWSIEQSNPTAYKVTQIRYYFEYLAILTVNNLIYHWNYFKFQWFYVKMKGVIFTWGYFDRSLGWLFLLLWRYFDRFLRLLWSNFQFDIINVKLFETPSKFKI